MFNRQTYAAIYTLIFVATLAGVAQPGGTLASVSELPQVDASLYAVTPQALQPVECGQCHTGQFADLKSFGGKHRFACQQCHAVFHAYNPRKNNYADLMPLCATCHVEPHGAKQTDCLNCHQNPHAPLRVPAMERLGNACADCHLGPSKEMQKFPSAHAEQGCQSCHQDKHGYIPNCLECHDGHYAQQAIQDCMTCHDRAHAPLQIGFPGDAKVQTCNDCHDAVYGKWQRTPSKHGQVSCTACHLQHAMIPSCLDCHDEPHNKKQLEMFPNCLSCHLDVHDLPVKKKQ